MKGKYKQSKFLMEVKDLLAGTAFPLMLQVVLCASVVGMLYAIIDDFVLSAIILAICELLIAVAMVIFGRQSGIVAVRRVVQHAKKKDLGSTQSEVLFGTGEYSAYKGFLMGFLSCVPYIVVQLIECCVHTGPTTYLLQYVFGWAYYPFRFAGLSQWLNFLMVLFPTIVHGVAYVIGAHVEWNKQQKMAELQRAAKQ